MWEQILNSFPWLQTMGVANLVKKLIRDDLTVDEILSEVRQSTQYQRMFPGMVDVNGQRRFATEREYLDTVRDYRDVLIEFGSYDPAQDDPLNYTAFFDAQIDPNELKQRFAIYRELEAGSDELRDAFYVYAGMDVTVDDLYQASVSPEFREQLTTAYDTKVAGSSFDYQTYITRATERGLQRTAKVLQQMQRQGLVTGAAVSKLLNVDPTFAREVMGGLFSSDPADTGTLGLEELLVSFDYAMLASAATESGLEMPTRERLAALRQAGVDRARAMRAYGQYSGSKEALRGMARRSGAEDFTQQMFEEASLLGKGPALDVLNRAVSQEQSLGRSAGSFSTDLDQGRVAQSYRR